MPAAIPIALAVGTAGGGAAAGYFGMKGSKQAAQLQSAAAMRAAQLQTDAANRAADVSSASNDATLKFQQDAEAERKKEFYDTQQQNLVKYNEELARRQPFVDMGVGALAQIGRPRPMQAGAAPGAPYKPLYSQTPAPPGTLGDILAKKQAGA
jgi:hypothetical protein